MCGAEEKGDFPELRCRLGAGSSRVSTDLFALPTMGNGALIPVDSGS